MIMTQCSNCGRNFRDLELECPHCGEDVDPERAEIIREIKNLEKRRNYYFGIFILGMFGIWLLHFIRLVLIGATVSSGLAIPLGIYNIWKKHKAEKKLKKISEESEERLGSDFDS